MFHKPFDLLSLDKVASGVFDLANAPERADKPLRLDFYVPNQDATFLL